jgi:hypothetical protein
VVPNRTFDQDVFSGDMKPVKLPKHSIFSQYPRKGLNAHQAEFAVKKYKSHCWCSPTLMVNLGVLIE